MAGKVWVPTGALRGLRAEISKAILGAAERWLSSFGASQKVRQQKLGHADGSPVTETIYTHVISEDGKRIGARLGKAVQGLLCQKLL
jgi:hypothetical protein